MKRFINNLILFLIVFAAILFVFYRGLFNFYFQDDFIHLSLGWITSISDFFKLIKPIPYFPYRPIAIQVLSFVAVHIFNLNPLPAHILLFILHGVNIVLLWKVLNDFFSQKLIKFVVVFLYGINTTHFMLLYWWSILFMLLSTTFFLLTFLILCKYEKKPTGVNTFGYFFLLFLMLITNEALFVFPFFVVIYSYFFKKRHVEKLIFPSFLFSALFILLRIYFAKYPLSSDYKIGNLVEIIRTARWYFLRAANLPEGVKIMSESWQKIVLSLFVMVWGLLGYKFLKGLRHLKREDFTKFLFGISWYLIFAFPFFLLSSHISSYYLNTALIGFFIALSSVCFSVKSGFVILTLFLYGLLSYLNADFLHKTHWVVWRAEVAKRYVEKTKKMYPFLPKGATLVFKDTKVSPSEISVALSGNKALRLYYNDLELEVEFSKDDMMSGRESDYVVSERE